MFWICLLFIAGWVSITNERLDYLASCVNPPRIPGRPRVTYNVTAFPSVPPKTISAPTPPGVIDVPYRWVTISPSRRLPR